VADHTRDKLIAERASKGECGPSADMQPTMLIDEDGIPHAFCLSKSINFSNSIVRPLLMFLGEEHSEIIAKRVKSWIEKVVEAHNYQSPHLFCSTS
jgi:hypothetical protein